MNTVLSTKVISTLWFYKIDKTEKKRVKDAFLKCLRNMHAFIKSEMPEETLSKAQS